MTPSETKIKLPAMKGRRYKLMWFTYRPDVIRDEEAIGQLGEGAILEATGKTFMKYGYEIMPVFKIISNGEYGNKVSIKTWAGEKDEPIAKIKIAVFQKHLFDNKMFKVVK
jgi:hypothetical protein